MTTTDHLKYWPDSDDRRVDVINPEALPWDSQYDHCSAVEDSPDSLVCIDPFQEAFPDISDFLFDQSSLLTLGGIPDYYGQVMPSDGKCASKNSDPLLESHGICSVAANDRQQLQSPTKEPRTNFHREKHVSESYDSQLIKTPAATRISGNTLSASPEQHFPKHMSETESYFVNESKRRKRAHCLVAKRYREILNSKFLQLEMDVLNIGHDQDRKDSQTPSQKLKPFKRPEVLELAHQSIFSLQKEVCLLKRKLQILREATIPFETCQYTLPDG